MSAQLRDAVKAALEEMEKMPCTFWACEGPDAPFVQMMTCSLCGTVQDLRAALLADEAVPS